MAERKLTESEVERRIERAHPASMIARLAAIHLKARYRWTGESWQAFNALSGRFSPVGEFTIGALLGLFTATTGRTALSGADAATDTALANPDWPAIEQAMRVLLDPGSKFLTAPIETPMPAQAPTKAERRGLQCVPSEPAGSRTRHRQSRVMRA
jgi:hypothetical protein